MIYHISQKQAWQAAQVSGSYQGDTLQSEGFIHCSTLGQVLEVANRIFLKQENLVLLCIIEEKVRAKIIYENLEGGQEQYPHIYGELNLDAVTGALAFPCREDGSFVLPEKLQ